MQMKLSIDVGEDFPLDAEVIEARARYTETKTRGRIALLILGLAAVAVVTATIIGLADGSFNELNCVWIAAGPFIGAVVGHYLGRKNE